MIAALHIDTCVKNGRTILANSYHTPPFKLANITEDKSTGWLHLMTMSASPGIMDGDQYQIQLHLAEGSKLQLQSQSYQRLYNMKLGATQTLTIRMEPGSTLYYLPHPIVPQEAAIFTASNTVYLHDNCCLLLSEVITCGRKGNGEQFAFTRFFSNTDIYCKGDLVLRERLLMQPALTDPLEMGQLEGYTHQASVFFLYNHPNLPQLQQQLVQYLQQQPQLTGGVTATAIPGLAIRMLGNGAETLFNCVQQLAQIITLALLPQPLQHVP